MLSEVYLPFSSLDDEDIESLVTLALNKDKYRVDVHGGRKLAIQLLLNLQSLNFNLSKFIDSPTLLQLEKKLAHLNKFDFYKKELDENAEDQFEPYWELTNNSSKISHLAKNNRSLTDDADAFSAQQLKIYFNCKQISNIAYSTATFKQSHFVDEDSRQCLVQFPLNERSNQGLINTKKGRIERVLFEIPEDKQIIILDFADERMPGGLFLYGASTQEETICYNSNTYRALLDFKYQRFHGGFFIPEFGCLYIKKALFVNPDNHKQTRYADVIVAACYDLTGEHGLYEPPHDPQQIEINTKKKLETVVAAAQANSDDNGQNTFLILGPIGCGAFQNKLETIVQLWAQILLRPLNQTKQTQQRHAFDTIWFLSGTDRKLKTFENTFLSVVQERL